MFTKKSLVPLVIIFITLGVWSKPIKPPLIIPIEKETLIYADTLKLDFYSLQDSVDPNRALILLVHGGGFSGGRRDNPEEVDFAKKMAAEGYAVASISYRLTRKGKSFGCDCPANEKIETFVSSVEDVTKAIQFLQEKSDYFKFDKQKTVLMGSSAGAEAVLNTAFLHKDSRFEHIEKVPIAGIISLSGAKMSTTAITKENAVPVLFIHGERDNLVPYATAAHHYCNPDDVGYLLLEGPRTMANELKKLQVSYILAFDSKGNHDWAGKGYTEVKLIHLFIEKIIIGKILMQKEIQIG